MKTKILAISILMVLLFGAAKTEAKTKPYYSGDAIAAGDITLVGTVNMGFYELFGLDKNGISRLAVIRPAEEFYVGNKNFLGAAFANENGKIFAYLVDGRYIYKYDLSDPYLPVLAKKVKDSQWDWFMDVRVAGDNIYTIGKHGVKVWNNDLEAINAFNGLTNESAYNMTFSGNGNFIFNLEEGKLKIYDARARKYVSEVAITVNEKHNRKIYNDAVSGRLIIADDENLLSMNFDGTGKKFVRHISNLGYDVAGSDNKSYLYFSDGLGLVKFDKATLKPLAWKYAKDLFGGESAWMMGLKVVSRPSGDVIITFTDSAIVALDAKLNRIGYIKSTEDNIGPFEPLALSVDKNRAPRGANFLLTGRGFMQSEPVDVMIGDTKYIVRADANGRFSQIFTIPEKISGAQFPLPSDVKVESQYSGLKYSIGFTIE
ncbi:MAG: hypothetical protein WCW25_02685 [Patescibacteria group bacterium]|jgi:hypothetical protein